MGSIGNNDMVNLKVIDRGLTSEVEIARYTLSKTPNEVSMPVKL